MKITKTIRRFFKLIFTLLFLLVASAIIIPYFFKDEIIAKIKEDINRGLHAEVEFSDISLSLLRNFPDFSFDLSDFSIHGVGEFEGIALASTERLRLSLDIKSVFNRNAPIAVHEIVLQNPTSHILILKDEKANYDIVKSNSNVTETTQNESGEYNFLIQLEKYQIINGSLIYDDRSGGTYVELEGIEHSGKGDFTQDIFDLHTQTRVDHLTARTGGITYLKKARTIFDAVINANIKENKYTLKDNQLLINNLKLIANGFVMVQEGSYPMNLDISAPDNRFKDFLSLIPGAYTKNYADVKADGRLKLIGHIEGTYNAVRGLYPAFSIKVDIADGAFQYPGLPLGVVDILARVHIESPSTDLDQMTVDIPEFKLEIGDHPFEGRFALSTPISDPNVNTRILGKLVMQDLSKAFPMEGISRLDGIIDTDLTLKARLSELEEKTYSQVNMNGDLKIQGLHYEQNNFPTVRIKTAELDFSPQRVKINSFDGQLGKSDIKGTGTIDNILAYFSPEKRMTGTINFTSGFFDSNEWIAEEETVQPVPAGTATDAESQVFDRFDFEMKGTIGKLLYDVYELDNSRVSGSISPSTLEITSFDTKIGASDLSGSGKLTNLFPYLYDNENLGGQLKINSRFFDLNPFMEETENTGPEAKTIANEEDLEPFQVPERMDLIIDANIKELLYTDLKINNISGKAKVKDEAINFSDVEGNALGGKMMISGAYDTTNPEEPGFDLDYELQQFDFQKTFKQFNTFAALASVGKYIQGKFNTKMSFSGRLGKDLYPILDNVNADGFIQTFNSVVNGFGPLESISNKLNLSVLKKLKLENTKNWFTVKDGFVTVKDFKLSQQGIDMIIGGSHGINQEMQYHIQAKIPRSMMQSNAVSDLADKGLGFLENEAKKVGLNLGTGEFINVRINLGGTLNKPKLEFKVLGSEGGQGLVETVREEVREVVETKVGEVKEEAKELVETKKEDYKAKMDAEINSIMKAAEQQSKLIRDKGRQAAAEAKKLGYAQADNLVKEAGNNILKKKAAEIAANKLKKETDSKALGIEQEANRKADQVMAEARKRADEVRKKYEQM